MERLDTGTLSRVRSWSEAGDLFSHDTSRVVIDATSLPVFTLKLSEAYQDLAKNGTEELSNDFFVWMRRHMRETPEQTSISRMHDVFNRVFPVPGLPARVAPEFSPWIEAPTFDPRKYVVVQPVIFVPQRTSDVFAQRFIGSEAFAPPRVDPFLVATLSTDGSLTQIPYQERAYLGQMIRAFWESTEKAHAAAENTGRTLASGNIRQAALETVRVMETASVHVSEVATRMKNYVLNQDSPLSVKARAAIQFAWVFKAAEEWMKPIKTLAKEGRIELPRGI
jgi:hypothetical protein